MSSHNHLDDLLKGWRYAPGEVAARRVQGEDGRPLVQLRVDLGILQLETEGRPDGTEPEGHATYYDLLLELADEDPMLQLTDDQCIEVDREFVQFYHRRIAWLALREFDRAAEDADHTLALMDFTAQYTADTDWIAMHEQYRPFVLFHRTQSVALDLLEHEDPTGAIEAIEEGVLQLRTTLAEVPSQFDVDYEGSAEYLKKLVELQASIRDDFGLEETLAEQLEMAIAEEHYELAAQLRDQIAERQKS